MPQGMILSEKVIQFEQVTICYKGGLEAVKDVSFAIAKGEFVSLIGPSGCGKSTIANATAQILSPRLAEIRGDITVQAQRMGYVSQQNSLFPWRTVRKNVEIGLEIKGRSRVERAHLVDELLEKVALKSAGELYPYQLSGGMRQRAMLARCLAYDPDVILMDEPFGALDAQARILMQEEFLRICSQRGKTFLLITHDIAEAITMSDRIILLSHRPSTIRCEYSVKLSNRSDPLALRRNPQFLAIQSEIWSVLSDEVRKQSVN